MGWLLFSMIIKSFWIGLGTLLFNYFLPNLVFRSKTLKTRTEDKKETGIDMTEDLSKTSKSKLHNSQTYFIVAQNDLEYSAASNHQELYSR